MNQELAPTQVKGLSIDQSCYDGLTRGQEILMELISECYGLNEPITFRRLLPAYFKAKPEMRLRTYDDYCAATTDEGVRTYVKVRRRYDDPFFLTEGCYHHPAQTGCYAWFRGNLGSCIVKGRMIAIPVIDLDDESPKKIHEPSNT